MRIGYARVSTQDQRLDVQHEALTRSGCDKVFDDAMSGKATDRPGLLRALDVLRKGDTLVVWKLDRLGRSVKQLDDLVRIDVNRGADFLFLHTFRMKRLCALTAEYRRDP